MRDPRLPLVAACFVLSGVAGLIYQTAWTQQLALVFGTSEPAIATVLAAYMAGLAAGAELARRFLLPRMQRPLRVYGLLELGIAVSRPGRTPWSSARPQAPGRLADTGSRCRLRRLRRALLFGYDLRRAVLAHRLHGRYPARFSPVTWCVRTTRSPHAWACSMA